MVRTLSASQIKRFQKCRRVWWLSQFKGKSLRPYSNMIVGIMVHNLLEHSIQGLKYDLLSDLENHMSKLSNEEAAKVQDTVTDKNFYIKLKEIKGKVIDILGTKKIDTEKYFSYLHKTKECDGLMVNGYFDISNPKTGDVFDLKVGTRALYDNYIAQNYAVQMELYRRGAMHLYKKDHLPEVTIISVGLQAGTVVPFKLPAMPTKSLNRMLARIAHQMRTEETEEYKSYDGFCEVCGEAHEFIEYSNTRGLTSKHLYDNIKHGTKRKTKS